MVCLETSFIIDLLHGKSEAIKKYEEIRETNELIQVPSPCITEIISGASLNVKKEEKEQALELFSTLDVLNLDRNSAILAGEIEASLILSGETIGSIDIMIAAICLQNNEKLITRNKKHFDRIRNLKIIDY